MKELQIQFDHKFLSRLEMFRRPSADGFLCSELHIRIQKQLEQLSSFCLYVCFGLIFFFSSCSDSSLSKMSPCSEAGKPCNPCLDAAKACNLNETCKRLRSAYNSICSKATPPQPSLANQEPCSRKRCQKVCAHLLSFIFYHY